MRDSDLNLYDYDRLRQTFGAFAPDAGNEIPGKVERDILGDTYRLILQETVRLVTHQWREHLQNSAIKGFLFYGGVGVGKTTMAKRLTYELCRTFGDMGTSEHPENEVVLIMVDGSDIARGRYGDSEERLAELFEYARDGESHGHSRGDGPGHRHDGDAIRRTVLLFDDVESLFLARSAGSAKEWHLSQNSVFFHGIDELDTAHTIVVLTTNRIDLVDEAVVDRFLRYEFPAPSKDVMAAVATERARAQRLDQSELAPILAQIREDDSIRSLREVERLVTRTYVEKVLGAR